MYSRAGLFVLVKNASSLINEHRGQSVHSLNNIEEQSLELKYCERCGTLWVRRTKSSATLCRKCVQHMSAMPRSFAENILGKIASIQAFSDSPEVRV